jgi:hypothetical protein
MAEKQNCKAKDCANEVVGKGYCRKHYRLWKRGEMPKARYKICTEEKCRKARFHGSLCEQHYNTARGKGAAEAAPTAAPAPTADASAS